MTNDTAPLSIASPQNPRFKLWETALDGRGLKKNGTFLLAGRKTVPEAIERWPQRLTTLIVPAEDDFAWLSTPASIERVVLSRALFNRLDVSGTGFPLLAGPVPSMAALDPGAAPIGLEVVLALGDPGNLGAMLRSAVAFGAKRVILMAEAAHPFHPRCLRGAANAPFELTLLKGPSWADLGGGAQPLLALDGDGEDLSAFTWPANARLVLGEEGLGVPDGLPAKRLAIPTTGAVESLNATVAASLALYSAFIASRVREG